MAIRERATKAAVARAQDPWTTLRERHPHQRARTARRRARPRAEQRHRLAGERDRLRARACARPRGARAPERSRATVACGRNGRVSGSYTPAPRQPARHARLQRGRARRRGPRPPRTAPARGAAAAAAHAPSAQRRRRPARPPPARAATSSTSSSGRVPEERRASGAAPRRARAATPSRRPPRRGTPPAPPRPPRGSSSATNSRSHTQSRSRRCIATVVVRSRTIARPPGSCTVRSIRSPPACGQAQADRPDRLLLRPAARPGDPGDADPDVGAEARDRAVGQRRRHLGRDRAVRARSARDRTPASATLASFEYAVIPPERVRRGAAAVGQPRRHQPARARLRGRHRAPAVQQRAITRSSIVSPSRANSRAP